MKDQKISKKSDPAISSIFNKTNKVVNSLHPGAPPSAPPLLKASDRNDTTITNSSASSSSSSSSSSSARLDHGDIYTNANGSGFNDLEQFTATTSIIGGLNPIWSFENEKQSIFESQQINGNFLLTPLSNQSFQKQQPNDLEQKSTNMLDDRNILKLSRDYHSKSIQSNETQGAGSSSPNNKPIGYERHEKQIINNNLNSPANVNLNGQSLNVPTGMYLNNLNIDEFSSNLKNEILLKYLFLYQFNIYNKLN